MDTEFADACRDRSASLIASPPMATIEPAKRQLGRLTRGRACWLEVRNQGRTHARLTNARVFIANADFDVAGTARLRADMITDVTNACQVSSAANANLGEAPTVRFDYQIRVYPDQATPPVGLYSDLVVVDVSF